MDAEEGEGAGQQGLGVCGELAITQLDDLSPLYWNQCIDHLYFYISNIPGTQKYSIVIY